MAVENKAGEDSSTFQLSKESLGHPGIPGELVLVPQSDGLPPDMSRLKDDKPRIFEVIGVLKKLPAVAEGISYATNANEGSSFVMVPDHVQRLIIERPNLKIVFELNDKHELSTVSMSLSGTSKGDVLTRFHSEVGPLLDHLSYLADVPIAVDRVVAVDTKNMVQFVSYVGPHREKILSSGTLNFHMQLTPMYALYREAKASASSFYKFLCYFKILEGVKFVRSRNRKKAQGLGISLASPRETVPENAELRRFRPDLIGKPVWNLYSNLFQAEFRNAIAHFSRSDVEPLVLSDYVKSSEIANLLLAIELCCRVVIATEQATLAKFSQEGAEKQS